MEEIDRPAEALLIITGSMGAGKTAVLDEASDILSCRGIPHAGIDLDALGIGHFPSQVKDSHVMYRNLRCLWKNYAGLGLTRLIVARALEDRTELDRIRKAVSGSKVTVCRLMANKETMQERVRHRDSGTLQHSYVARVTELNAILDRSHLEDFSVVNENRSVTDVAQEMLMRSGWL